MTTAPQQGATNPQAGSGSVALRSLGAQYDPEHHDVYVMALRSAIDSEPAMRNIALTGAYGTGKSSVLSKVADLYDDRVLELSLSTVGAGIDETDATALSATVPHVKTLGIQKEIVKQILYRDAPARTRGSRFRRIARFRIWREIGVGLGVGAVVLGLLFLSGLSTPLVAVAADNTALTVLAYFALLLVLAGVIVTVRWASHNRVFLEKLSAGPATVSLAATQPTSYFDQYMDEIVYYFEQSGRDIVIFEDIDRFDEAHIFETLRALNTLLNGAEQVRYRRGHSRRQQRRRARRNQRTRAKKHQRKHAAKKLLPTPDVKFIYAMRDSVFEKLGTGEGTGTEDAAKQEIQRANRTKFFDLVIPMVPFITHRNARDLMIDEMAGTGVSPALTDLAARHVADKRLIVNMRNEYDVFANRLLGKPSTVPGLDEDRLFATILYKNVHMADFEAIRFGTSALDRLHTAWQDLVEGCVDSLTRRSRDLQRQITDLDAVAERSERLGGRLELLSTIGSLGGYGVEISVANTSYDSDGVRSAGFWRAVTGAKQSVSFRNTGYGSMRTMTFDELRHVLGEDLDAQRWQRQDRAKLVRERAPIPAKLAFLRHHSWQDIYARPEFVAEVDPNHGPESFRMLTDRLLGSDLARDLVAGGFVNDYFALYISMYYGRHLRRDALNFIVHALDQGEPSPLYPLEGEDVEAILRDRGEGILRDRRIYNVAIVDHLLRTNDHRTVTMIKQIATWGAPEQRFASRYLASGTSAVDFVAALAPMCEPLLPYLVSEVVVEDALRIRLVDVALAHLDAERDYSWDDRVAAYVRAHYLEFETLTDQTTPQSATTAAMDQVGAMTIELPRVRGLNPAALEAATERGVYALNVENLLVLTGETSIALDTLSSDHKRIYDTVVARLHDYLAVVQAAAPSQYAVDGTDQLLPLLRELDDQEGADAGALARLVHLAAPGCRVPVLTDAPTSVWPVLVGERRTDPSATNLTAYLELLGEIDDNVGLLLEDVTSVAGHSALETSERESLAIALLDARAHLPTPAQRVRLAASLTLEDYLDASALSPESGELAGLLIDADIVTDDASTFTSSLIADWSAREFAITKSAAFPRFVHPRVLPAEDLPAFFASTLIDAALKDTVIEQLADFLPAGETRAADAAGHHALARGLRLNADQLQALRSGRARLTIMIELIARSSVSGEELRDLVRPLGSYLAKIADPGSVRPLVPDDAAHRALLDRLHLAGVVSKYTPEKGQLRVFLFKRLNPDPR